ncbi:MAG: hypothetical protein ACI31F_02560 [Muribaculaceae bacterium]
MLLMAMTLSFAFTSCSDDDDDDASIIGTWYWYDEGEFEEMQLNSNGTYATQYGYDGTVYNVEYGTYTYNSGSKRLILFEDSDISDTELYVVKSLTKDVMILGYEDSYHTFTYNKIK